MDLEYLDSNSYENNVLFFRDYLNYIYLYLNECTPSVVSQAFQSNLTGLLLCLLLNLFCTILHKIKGFTFCKDILICVFSTIAGVYLLLTSFENGAWSIFLFAATSTCIICFIKPTPRLMGILGICAIYLVFNETYIDSKQWHALRGPFMILLMKVISVAIDIDKGDLISVSMLKLIGYLMSPCSLLYGPWFDYRAYVKWSNASTISFSCISKFLKAYCFGTFFLLFSTCLSQMIFSGLPDNKWIKAYQDAQSFRFSHYFISFLSLSYLHAMNIEHITDPTISRNARQIVDPISIELPRSLIDVVTLWNLPMHFWLKNYIFFPCRRFGRFAAILLTFTASSLLHGFNFALSAILISLGVYSYIEYVFRSQLAKTLSACIKARPCFGDCPHKFKKTHLLTILVNLAFTVLAMFQLAYIAAMLDDSVGHSEGYSMQHTLNVWKRLHFSGHIVAFINYFLYLIFKSLT